MALIKVPLDGDVNRMHVWFEGQELQKPIMTTTLFNVEKGSKDASYVGTILSCLTFFIKWKVVSSM